MTEYKQVIESTAHFECQAKDDVSDVWDLRFKYFFSIMFHV